MPDSVLVGAEGRFDAEPDVAIVRFDIQAQEEKLDAAQARASRAAEQVREVLRRQKLPVEAGRIGLFSVEAVYDHQTARRRLVGYRVMTEVEVELRDFAKANALAQSFAAMDVTGNHSLRYELKNPDAARLKALAAAFENARAKAATLAKAGGRTLGELVWTTADAGEPGLPIPMGGVRMQAAMAEDAPPPTAGFKPGLIRVSAHVTALFRL